ncbi:MAG: FkbM family methyltransferase [Christensenellales bacterium]|jgi:FkbM family methyltransferase
MARVFKEGSDTEVIKDILNKFLPPSTRTFNREIERVLSAVNGIQQDVNILHMQIKQELKQYMDNTEQQYTERLAILQGLKEHLSSLTKLEQLSLDMLQLQQDIKQVEQVIPNKPIYWSNAFERRVVQGNWGDVTGKSDFAQKFLRLTAGMDPQSIESIVRILIRQKKYLNCDQKFLDLFTRQEQEELRLLSENFYSEILKLSDDLYAYKNYLLPINHFESSVFYYKHGLAQVKTLAKVKGKAIVDVGGFIGDSVLILSELSPSSIYTFEAVPENFELLKKTMEMNCIQNVVAENVALGAETGKFALYVEGPCSSSIRSPGINYKGTIEVPVIKLDDYVEEHKIDVGLIKIDIEGGEPAFLVGAKKTICKQKPILLLSIYHNAHDFFELKPLIETWGLGYKFSVHKPVFGNATSETLLLAEIR